MVMKMAEAEEHRHAMDAGTVLGSSFECVDGVGEIREADWLWKGWLPKGEVVLWAGNGGTGKSTAICDLVARITRGAGFPMEDGEGAGKRESSMCIYLTGEDSLSKGLRPKLVAAGADLSLVRFPVALIEHTGKGDIRRSVTWDLVKRVDAVEGTAQQCAMDGHRVALFVIDPVTSFLGGSTDENSNSQVKELITKLHGVAERTGMCIVLINHLNKKSDIDDMFRVQGSSAWIHGPRLVTMFKEFRMNVVPEDRDGQEIEGKYGGRVPDDAQPQASGVMAVCIKSNLGAKPAPIRVSTEKAAVGRVVWDGWKHEFVGGKGEVWTCRTIWRRMPRSSETREQVEIGGDRTARVRANVREWLRAWLLREPTRTLPAGVIYAEGFKVGYGRTVINRAVSDLPITRIRLGSSWVWRLEVTGRGGAEKSVV
jgi:RecA/RadA recombinase